ncbi:MAG: membrane protein insertase YidC [Bacteroidetes bacterium]|nr:membrane protein insertase YidC [Bacteroidota bacterium]
MNRNTILGIVLIFAILIGYSYLTRPSKEELAKQKSRHDSLVQLQKKLEDSIRTQEVSRRIADSIQQATAPAKDTSGNRTQQLHDQMGRFAVAAEGEEKLYSMENEFLKIKVSSKGGRIVSALLKQYQTWDSLPLELISRDSSAFGFTFFSNNRVIRTGDLYFKPFWPDQRFRDKDSIFISGNDSVSFAMRVYPGADTLGEQNSYLEFKYTLRGNDYMTGYTVSFIGLGQAVDPGNFIVLDWKNKLSRKEKGVKYERMNSSVYYKYFEDKVDYISETKDEIKKLKGERVKWISFKDQFFSTVLIAETNFSEPTVTSLYPPDKAMNYNKMMAAEIDVPYTPGRDNIIPMKLYMGPNKYYTLKKYKLDMERQIPLGYSFFLLSWINIYAVIPVFTFFGDLGWNYGIIILILTILLKIVLFPIAYKTYVSSARMRVLKPEIDEINEKHKKDEPMKKQQAIMDLYKRAGVNPMAGCIPLLLQMPILIAMFRFFPSSIELRQQPFLWADDLSSYDAIWTFPNGFTIPWYGGHVSLFALLMTISSIIYTRLNDQMMGSSSTQLPGMKTMMYLMPVMFLFWFNDFSSGLSYYYLLANLLTFAQIFIIRATIDEQKLHAQIEQNRKKPVKKSGFQKRLEDMAKKRGYQMPRK